MAKLSIPEAEIKTVGKKDKGKIDSLARTIRSEAEAYLKGTDAARAVFYTKQIDVEICEADARYLHAKSHSDFSFSFMDPSEGLTRVKITPKELQKKGDGRGVQMNFWLYYVKKSIDQYHKNFNIHVKVIPLERTFESYVKTIFKNSRSVREHVLEKGFRQVAVDLANKKRAMKHWARLPTK